MRFTEWLKTTPVWLALPSLLVAGAVGGAVVAYEPLVFDPSLYETPRASAEELSTVDAEALEAQHKAQAEPVQVSLDTGGAASLPTTAASNGALADGSWTGYAPCGKGNPDGWKAYYVAVTVKVADGKVAGITGVKGSSMGGAGNTPLSWDAAENQTYLSWADTGHNGQSGVKQQINKQLSAKGKVADVDMVSGATYSSAAIYNAYVDAVEQAAKAGGAKASSQAGARKKDASEEAAKQKAKKKAASSGKKTATSKQPDATKVGVLADGTWTAYAQCGPDPDHVWNPYYIGVTLTVRDGKVVSIDKIFASATGDAGDKKLVWDAAENQEYLDGAVWGVGEQLDAAVAAGKVLGGVDTVSGATFSSQAIYAAYYGALKKAADAAGSTVEVSGDDAAAQDAPSGAGSEGSGASADAGEQAGAGTAGQEAASSGAAAGETAQAGGSGSDAAAASDAPAADGSSASETADAVQGTDHYGFAYCSSAGGDSWSPYYIFVKVTAKDGVVTKVDSAYGDADGMVDPAVKYSASENATYLNWAIDGKFGGRGYRMKSVIAQIQAKLDAQAEVAGVQTVSGATRSSNSIIEAYQMAAANAAAGTATTPQEAVQATR